MLVYQFVGEALFYGHSFRLDLTERLYYALMTSIRKEEMASQLTGLLAFHVYFLYQMRNENLKDSMLGGKSIQYYFAGIGILLAVNIFIGAGFSSFVNDRYAYGIESHNGLGRWLNEIIQLFVPMTGLYLSIIFLRWLRQIKPEQNHMRYYFEVVLISYILFIVVGQFTILASTAVFTPVISLIRSEVIMILLGIFLATVIINVSLILQTYLVEAILQDVSHEDKTHERNTGDVIDQL